MTNRVLVVSALVASTGALGWVLASRESWGAHLVRDPANRSGRVSLCERPAAPGGSLLDVAKQNLGEQPSSRGIQSSYTYIVDTVGLTGGRVAVCSEYGFVRLRGVDETTGRLLITVSNPFPGGDRAVANTEFDVDVREVDGALH